jgi:uracil-DNA glycosylase family 4
VSLSLIQQSVVACDKCPRLRTYCARVAAEKKRAHRHETYWGRPVPGFGDPAARLLVVGLAPAAHGGNRTGRVFTGDSSGDFLFRALHKAGFANQPTSTHVGDGLRLTGAYVAAAVRCAPPDNKPTPAELARCLPWLAAELEELNDLRAIVALGRIAFDATLRLLRERGLPRTVRPAFGHGLSHRLSLVLQSQQDHRHRSQQGHRGLDHRSQEDHRGLVPRSQHRFSGAQLLLISSYHPSRQNTNTGKLTEAMFDEVFAAARSAVSA